MEEAIDYKPLYETIQHENEQLRLRLLKLRTTSAFSLNWQAVRDFACKNQVMLVVIIMAAYYLGSLTIDVVEMLWRARQ